MEIAIIEPVGGHRGMNYYDYSLASGLASNDCNVRFYTSDETMQVEEKIDGVTTIPSFKRIYGKDNKIFRELRFIKGLLKSVFDVRKRKIQIAHLHFFHSTINEYLICFCIRYICKAKTVITVHDIESFSGSNSIFLQKATFSFASHFILHNQFSKKEFLRIFPDFSDKASVNPHGNYMRYIPSPSERAFEPSRSELRILFFGQIKEVKGLDILLEAFELAIKSGYSFKLTIAGSVWKYDLSEIESYLYSHHLKNHIRLDDRYIPDNEVHTYFLESDIVVLPYRKIYQSGVLLKALSYGKCVVVSDLPPMLEIIEDKKNGFVFKSNNSQSLFETLSWINNNKDSIEEISNRALEMVNKEFDWNVIGKKTKTIYETL